MTSSADFGLWSRPDAIAMDKSSDSQWQQDEASRRLADSAYMMVSSNQRPIPSPSAPPIEGRATYGGLAPIALDHLTPGLGKPSESSNGTNDYLDYMDLSIARSRQLNAEAYMQISQAAAEKQLNLSDAGFKQFVVDALKPQSEDANPLITVYREFLEAQKTDNNPVMRLHTTAAMEVALASYILEKGTVINPAKADSDGRIMAKTNLDLGSHAAGYLFAADKNLYDLQNYLKQNNLAGAEDVQKSRDYIQQKLKPIFGPHDIAANIDALKRVYRQNIIEMAHFQIDMVQHVRAMPVRSPAEIKFAAKGCRDVAVLNLAIAQYKAEQGDGEGANIIYKEAVQFYNVAAQLDGKNGDIPQLKNASDKLGPIVEAAIKKQYDNWFNNPFGVERR